MKGKGTVELTNQMILQTFSDFNQLDGKSIYVSVSLLTQTGKTQQTLYICMHVYVHICVFVHHLELNFVSEYCWII